MIKVLPSVRYIHPEFMYNSILIQLIHHSIQHLAGPNGAGILHILSFALYINRGLIVVSVFTNLALHHSSMSAIFLAYLQEEYPFSVRINSRQCKSRIHSDHLNQITNDALINFFQSAKVAPVVSCFICKILPRFFKRFYVPKFSGKTAI